MEMTRYIIFTMMVMRMVWYGEYNGNENEGDDNELVDGDNNFVRDEKNLCDKS